jgi:hypothetical protein
MADFNRESDQGGPGDPEAPPLLLAELHRVYGVTPAVAPSVDQAILREARAGFGRRGRFRTIVRWTGAAAAVAAAVVVIVLNFRQDRPTAGTTVAGDVDRSGRVDIVDALVLAKQVEAGPSGGAVEASDVTGDGILDRRDVDHVANLAVKLR